MEVNFSIKVFIVEVMCWIMGLLDNIGLLVKLMAIVEVKRYKF